MSKSRTLTEKEIESLAGELDAIHRDVVRSLGEREANYIRRVRMLVRASEVSGRALLVAGGVFFPAWLLGAGLLSLSKIVENMELGHNVIHGQYDWMNDPSLQGETYEWDNASPADQWRHSHNFKHHSYTNVRNVDRDIGYAVMRLNEHEEWKPAHLFQPLYAVLLAIFFQWGAALHDLELERLVSGERPFSEVKPLLLPLLKKMGRVFAKEYVLFPLLAGPFFLPVLLGNLTADIVRNLWAFAIIFCGHFTANAETFPEESLASETHGQWYLRQIRGSSNIAFGRVLDFLSGNLSYQIEHHLFPDVPALRYAEMSVKVREICARYGQHYNTGPLSRQFREVVGRILRYSIPWNNLAPAAAH